MSNAPTKEKREKTGRDVVITKTFGKVETVQKPSKPSLSGPAPAVKEAVWPEPGRFA